MYPTLPVRPPSSRVPVRLSVETVSGRRRSVCVEIDRSSVDSDRAVMEKASAAYRSQHGFSDRVVAIYVSNTH